MSLSFLQWKMRCCQLIVFSNIGKKVVFTLKKTTFSHLRKHALSFGVSGNPDVQSGKTSLLTLKVQHQLKMFPK